MDNPDAYAVVYGQPESPDDMERIRPPIKPDYPPNYFGLQHWAAAKQKKWLDG